ncbi:hypothetical protein E2542_SST29240 [Spatholobus suberectus]|nr:hypothetical protein E2542_SST29240 [Spatholobus suberectus]
MTPYTYSFGPQQEDGVQFSDDKHFALHGKILLLVFLTVFFLLFVFVLMVPWLKKRAGRSHDSETDEDSTEGQNNTPSHNWFRRRRKEDVTPCQQHHATVEN